MSELLEFVRAMLDEDEKGANSYETRDYYGKPCPACGERMTGIGGPPDPGYACQVHHSGDEHHDYVGHGLTAEQMHEFILGDLSDSSKRTLREVEAKRRILDLADEASDLDMSVDLDRRIGRRDMQAEPYVGDSILRALASIWSTHPNYREEWAL